MGDNNEQNEKNQSSTDSLKQANNQEPGKPINQQPTQTQYQQPTQQQYQQPTQQQYQQPAQRQYQQPTQQQQYQQPTQQQYQQPVPPQYQQPIYQQPVPPQYQQPNYQQPVPPQYPQPGYQQPMRQQYQQPPYQQQGPKKKVGLAVASMVLGILSVVCWCYIYISIPMGIVGLVLGVISLKGDNGGRGMAIAGVVLSIICISLAALALIGCASCGYSTNSFLNGITDSSDFFDSNNFDSYFY